MDDKIDSVRILGIDYSVNFDDAFQTTYGDAGECLLSKCVINISENLNSDEFSKSVLLHEIIEAINYRLEMDLPHDKISQLESALIQVIRDNPELLNFLNA